MAGVKLFDGGFGVGDGQSVFEIMLLCGQAAANAANLAPWTNENKLHDGTAFKDNNA